MNDLLVLAQAVNAVDANAVGVSITSLVGSLGAAGAAVSVTYYFLNFLRDHGEKQNRLFDDFKDFHAETQKKFQEQLDRLTDRQEQLQRGYQEQVGRINESQNILLRDVIMAMKSVEKTMDNSTMVIQGIEKTVNSLQQAISAIDAVVRHRSEFRQGSQPTSFSHAQENSK
jgi:prefoldin subunit 5